MREIELILWYKGQGTGKPIFTLDTRTTPLLKHLTSSNRRTDPYKSKLASASLLSKLQQSPIITTGTKRAENRFTFNLTGELAYLQIRQVAPTDQSGYKCRVDYKQSRSDYHQVNLTVIGKCYWIVKRTFKRSPENSSKVERTPDDPTDCPFSLSLFNTVPPKSLRILNAKNSESLESLIGPFNEKEILVLTCQAKQGRYLISFYCVFCLF